MRHPFWIVKVTLWTAGLAFASGQLAPEGRVRIEGYLQAYHQLPPEKQVAVRQFDQALYEEDAITRQRLVGVMQRYAAWLSRLGEEEREKIDSVPAGNERLRLVRETLDQQWLASLPKSYRDELAAHPENRATLVAKWKGEERERRTARAEALRELEFGPPIERAFREEVSKWVKETLEPRLNKRERDRLNDANRPPWIGWFQQVAFLSNKHGVKPPGKPEFWRRMTDRNRPRMPPP
jgi:hypothetical protein